MVGMIVGRIAFGTTAVFAPSAPSAMEDLRYPVGRFEKVTSISPELRRAAIAVIAEAPARLREAVRGLTDAQLDTPYRPDGWTVRQVLHHVPDSHMNAFIRLKLGLTENNPTVKPYNEAAWAMLEDARSTPVETSLALMDALHDRWVRVLEAMTPDDFARTVMHPENGSMTLDQVLGVYEWHSRHHVAHITALRSRNGWS
jgi:uncharacterized damage-inducible protein DinB